MKRINRIFAALLICALLTMASCGPVAEPAATGYTIKVQDAQGNPIADALVGMCQDGEGGACYLPQKTDADGIVRFAPEAVPVQDNIKVRVLAAVGYDLPLDTNGDILYTPVPNGTTEMTLILEKLPG